MEQTERHRLFNDVVAAHQASIRRICRAYLYDQAATDDLCQEVLLNVWRHLERFEGRATWGTYLYRITVNTVIDHNRRRRPTVPLEDAPEAIDGSEHALSQKSAEEQRLDALHQAIQQLPVADRVIVSLLLEDLSYQQISEITGISASHVGVRINRCKEKLRKLLQL
jgi:RNA polymerase sigma factor (sigma-70 family)